MKNIIFVLLFLASGHAFAFDLFGPSNVAECRQKYAFDTNKVPDAKVAVSFACYASFNDDPDYLSNLGATEKVNFINAAKCVISKRDDVYSADSALSVATKCSDKYSSKIFPTVMDRAIKQSQNF